MNELIINACHSVAKMEAGHLVFLSLYFVFMFVVMIVAWLISSKLLNKTRILRFFGIYLILAACSFWPFTIFGFAMAFQHTIIAAILISIFVDKSTK